MHRIIFKKIYFFNVRIKKVKIARKSPKVRRKMSFYRKKKAIFKDPSDDGKNGSSRKWQKWSKNKLIISWQSFNSRFVNFRLPDWSNSALHAANWLSFLHFRKIFEKFRQKFPSYEYQYYHFFEWPYDTIVSHRPGLSYSIIWSLQKSDSIVIQAKTSTFGSFFWMNISYLIKHLDILYFNRL